MKAEMKVNTIWSNAKSCLKRYYWNGFGVALIFSAITGAAESITSSIADTFAAIFGGGASVSIENYGSEYLQGNTNITVESWQNVVFGAILSVAAAVFIGFIAKVCEGRFFSAARVVNSDLGTAFSPFKEYKKSLPMALRHTLYSLQWTFYTLPVLIAGAVIFNTNPELAGALVSIASIVAGIGTLIVSLKLFCVPYIYAENPDIDPKRAIELSFRMTEGHRGQIFGNLILCGLLALAGACCCGIGALFAMPMIHAVNAEMYAFLSDVARESGIADANELPGYAPAAQEEVSSGYVPVEAVVGIPTQVDSNYSNIGE